MQILSVDQVQILYLRWPWSRTARAWPDEIASRSRQEHLIDRKFIGSLLSFLGAIRVLRPCPHFINVLDKRILESGFGPAFQWSALSGCNIHDFGSYYYDPDWDLFAQRN